MAEAVLHLHERLDDEGGQVLPASDGVTLGSSFRALDGTLYKVVRRDDAIDPETHQIVKTWWECLPA